MATFRKVGKKWRAEIRKKGKYESKYFDSKMRARAWAEEVEARDAGPETFGQVLDRYADEVSPGKKGKKWEQVRLAKISRYDIANIRIAEITPKHMAEWRDERLGEISPSSVRRELTLLSAVFQKAVREWELCSHNPVKEIDKPSDAKPRSRRVSDDEVERITLALGFEGNVITKQHEVAVLFMLAIETAMRLGEMCKLTPNHIHLNDRFVTLIDTKNGTDRDVPLSTEAVRLLKLVPDGFTVSSGVASTLFRRARIDAGIHDLNFHDSRREALTRLAKKLDPMNLAKLSGHKDLKILIAVYYAPKASDIANLLD